MTELAAVHRSQGKPAEAMALARSAMTAFKELHDAQGLVDAAEVAVYSMTDGDDHAPIRDEALAVVDAAGKPLACGVLHEWADELFCARPRRRGLHPDHRGPRLLPAARPARPRGAVAGQPRPRLPPARTPG